MERVSCSSRRFSCRHFCVLYFCLVSFFYSVHNDKKERRWNLQERISYRRTVEKKRSLVVLSQKKITLSSSSWSYYLLRKNTIGVWPSFILSSSRPGHLLGKPLWQASVELLDSLQMASGHNQILPYAGDDRQDKTRRCIGLTTQQGCGLLERIEDVCKSLSQVPVFAGQIEVLVINVTFEYRDDGELHLQQTT